MRREQTISDYVDVALFRPLRKREMIENSCTCKTRVTMGRQGKGRVMVLPLPLL